MTTLEIFNLQGMAKAIRATEYESIYSAIAEIVDNSIEAEAKNIAIIIFEKYKNDGKKSIGDIAILDDGHGMNKELLHRCLRFGDTTKTESKGIGKFGVGLAQASLFACPRVEVFSWQNFGPKYNIYLDTKRMETGEQQYLYEPEIADIPREFSKFLSITLGNGIGHLDFKESGTLVYWNGVDNAHMTTATFYNKLSIELGRKFRYYIDNGVKIVVTNTQHAPLELVTAIDPLFLMEKSRILTTKDGIGEKTSDTSIGQPIFEPYISENTPDGVRIIPIYTEKKNGSPVNSFVRLKCSIVKEKNYYEAARRSGKNAPGETPIGKELNAYDNISIVRAGREIQFSKAKLYTSTNEPENRWWSIEISFDPELDEFFKLSNNKQKVEIMVDYRESKNNNFSNDEDSVEAQAWRLLIHNFDLLKREMSSRNKKIATGAKTLLKQIKNEGTSTEKEPKNKDIKSRDDLTYDKYFGDDSQIIKPETVNTSKIHNSKFDLLKSYSVNGAYLMENEPDKLFSWEIEDNFSIAGINTQHGLFDLINQNESMIIGLKIGLIAFARALNTTADYNEQTIYTKIINELNNELNYILQGVNEND